MWGCQDLWTGCGHGRDLWLGLLNPTQEHYLQWRKDSWKPGSPGAEEGIQTQRLGARGSIRELHMRRHQRMGILWRSVAGFNHLPSPESISQVRISAPYLPLPPWHRVGSSLVNWGEAIIARPLPNASEQLAVTSGQERRKSFVLYEDWSFCYCDS